MPDTPVTHADKLNRVRHGWEGQHPIAVEWLGAKGVNQEIVYVADVRKTAAVLTTTPLLDVPLAKLLRVNGALTTYGHAYYTLTELLEGREGERFLFRYAKSRTGEIKEYDGIFLGFQDGEYLALRDMRDGDKYKRFLIRNIILDDGEDDSGLPLA